MAQIIQLKASAYMIPTDFPESDGTITWDSTTMVLVEIEGGGKVGLGYTYADATTACFINKTLKEIILGSDVMNIPGVYNTMLRAIRNNGTSGLAAMAVSAVDNALWDLKAKMLDLSVAGLTGRARHDIPVYGSGGFTSYTVEKLQSQLAGWAEQGFKQVKMKIRREPEMDVYRVKMARDAIGENIDLFVDANGAYTVRQALEKAKQFADLGVKWFEEPVPSANLRGLHFIREHAPASINIAAGEYGFNPPYFENMADAGAVDVLQADATRCGGISGFMHAGYLCDAWQLPFSSHCAPAIHLHASMALPGFYTAEYFHDHVRIENMLFDGVQQPEGGVLRPDPDRPGFGLEFKHEDAARYKVV